MAQTKAGREDSAGREGGGAKETKKRSEKSVAVMQKRTPMSVLPGTPGTGRGEVSLQLQVQVQDLYCERA